MIIIVGLGNPGEKYEKTRHNLGFMAVDELARKLLPLEKTKWEENQRFNSQLAIINSQLILVKPQTFMKASGYAVGEILRYYDIKILRDLWVVHDDVDLELGHLRIRIGGGTGGHHGVESIIKELGTDKFVRFRLGIGHPGRGADALVERYVLREFDVNEKSEVKHLLKNAVAALKMALEEGLEKAANRYSQ